MAVLPVETALPLQSIDGGFQAPRPAPASGDTLFVQVLEDAVQGTNEGLLNAQAASEAFAAGKSDDIHGTMIALSSADIQLRTLGNVRTKVLDAFYELWRMSV